MIANINGPRSLVDIKTTSKLDVEALEWQLGMYQLAYGETFEKCYCLWLPKKDLGRLVDIDPKSKEEILKVLEEYEVSKDE
jgi:CRISPR/Cas system-associated exonuclease Cas4 (RecB family)